MSSQFPPNRTTVNYPHLLLDTLIDRLGLKNDAALCRVLEVAPPRISKLRRRRADVNDEIVLRIHEACGVTIAELRALVQADQLIHAARRATRTPPARHMMAHGEI
ncbi:MAG: hypothetical protein ACEQSK_11445 [Sphingomonadaceae bacterium]